MAQGDGSRFRTRSPRERALMTETYGTGNLPIATRPFQDQGKLFLKELSGSFAFGTSLCHPHCIHLQLGPPTRVNNALPQRRGRDRGLEFLSCTPRLGQTYHGDYVPQDAVHAALTRYSLMRLKLPIIRAPRREQPGGRGGGKVENLGQL